MRTASDINGIVDFICELCGSDGPGRTRDEIAYQVQLLRVLDYPFQYGENMEQDEEGNNSELRLLIDHLFDTNWILGENTR